MPRVPSRKRSDRDANAEPEASLEAQLARVIEREGVVISFAPNFFIEKKRRKSRTRRIEEPTEESEQQAPLILAATETNPSDDTVRGLDSDLIHRLRINDASRRAKPLTIRFDTHTPSPHLIELQPTIRRLPVIESRENTGETMEEWQAPYEFPPSVDHLVALTRDLFIESLDPRFAIEQFTPADPDVAFTERFGWWSRLRAPFIRWEVVQANAIAELKPTDHSQDEVLLLSTAEQFTSTDATQAFHQAYGWRERLSDWWHRRRQENLTEVASDNGEVVEEWTVPMVQPRLHTVRVLAGFLGLLAVVTLPAATVSFARSFLASVQEVKAGSQAAVADVQAALQTSGSDQSAALLQASERFQAADHALTSANALALAAAQVLPQTREMYQSARGLLLAGQRTADAARLLSQGLTRALEQSPRYPDERLLTFLTYMDSAATPLEEAADAVSRVNSDRVPASVRSQVEQLKEVLAVSRTSLRDMKTLAQLLLDAVGHDRTRNYLVLFQNETELRPTGGFIGSVAEVTLDRGEIKKVVVPGGGPYDLRNQLMVRVKPPQPLQLIAARWEFQDSNWFPDFPAAASKIRWFWSESGQPSVDGVIALNATLVQRMLAITGPIDMPEYGKTITAENFLLETQKAVELEYDKQENKPKKFIGDLLPKVLQRVKEGSREDWLKYVALLSDALDTKEIQVYLANTDEQALVDRWGWSGRLKPTSGDALAIIESNIAGQKTDGVIREQVAHQAEVQADGSIIDTVTLTRTHLGKKGDVFSGVNNVTYARVYVPQGSELLEASGFNPPAPALFKQPLPEDPQDTDVEQSVQHEHVGPGGVVVTDEFGRTAFGGWLQLEPGATSVTTYKYRLPFTAFDVARQAAEDSHPTAERAAYTLLLTSQSGKIDRTIETTIHIPAAWQQLWSAPTQAASVDNPLAFSAVWDRDRVIAHFFATSHDEASVTPGTP